ncbi:MAG TPA: protein-L-isoaspartate O-methyltransferase [Roseiarcus sp.]|jgi:protein-L-isoaspartate(D-aspartate) O-methyltransferase
MNRRSFLFGAAAAAAAIDLAPAAVLANVPTPFTPDLWPEMSNREGFVAWMKLHRGEDANFLGQRWDRYLQLISHEDVWDAADKRAYLMTPREEFVTAENLSRAYEWHHLNIGFGVTITGPHTVARMTNTLAIKPGDKVLEIGTGSGYQSAYLSYLTDKLWSIEIVPPLARRTHALYGALIARGYREYAAIKTKNADGYYGWEDAAPFDKIIVTCGIDHIPPPLLRQLKPGGIMVIPVGPPGAQHVIKAVKREGADGALRVARSDIYGGAIIPFVPFTGGHQGT